MMLIQLFQTHKYHTKNVSLYVGFWLLFGLVDHDKNVFLLYPLKNIEMQKSLALLKLFMAAFSSGSKEGFDRSPLDFFENKILIFRLYTFLTF